jgi:hypothetical protein
MRPNDSSIVDFVINLLIANKERLEKECRIGTDRAPLHPNIAKDAAASATAIAAVASVASVSAATTMPRSVSLHALSCLKTYICSVSVIRSRAGRRVNAATLSFSFAIAARYVQGKIHGQCFNIPFFCRWFGHPRRQDNQSVPHAIG